MPSTRAKRPASPHRAVRDPAGGALAHVGGHLARDLAEVSHEPRALDTAGRWAVAVTFEGQVTCARFRSWRPAPLPESAPWAGPPAAAWDSSLDRAGYLRAVAEVRRRIAAGDVYQVNLCRVLSAELPGPAPAGLLPLARRLVARHPAAYAALLRLPEHGVDIASASPELYLRRTGDRVESAPIKGTGRTRTDLADKDVAENVMIVDLVRNDLSRVCRPGTVSVPELLSVQPYPGLVHLVSTVAGRLEPGAGWADLLAATFPPGSVSGAPKSSALRLIGELEPAPRGPYCGALGWVDADTGEGELAVGIRTFWAEGSLLRFGTGAGITWGSRPWREWAETELKASRLVALASHGAVPAEGSG